MSATEHGCVDAEHAATLEGHSDWVRDLAFTEDASDASDANDANAEVDGSNDDGSDRSPGLLLASASQDRTARIWRVSRKDGDEVAKGAADAADVTASFAFMRLAAPPKPPSRLLGGGARLATHLEALLQGHDDWVLSAAWRPNCAPTGADSINRVKPGDRTPAPSCSRRPWTGPRSSGRPRRRAPGSSGAVRGGPRCGWRTSPWVRRRLRAWVSTALRLTQSVKASWRTRTAARFTCGRTRRSTDRTPAGASGPRAPRAPGTSRTSRARRGIRAAGGCSRDRAT